MSINQIRIENSTPVMLDGEQRIMERKDVQLIIDFQENSYSEEGILFLTTHRLIFIGQNLSGLTSFEISFFDIKDCTFYKKNNNRILEGYGYIENNRNHECKFVFMYDQTGFRSLVSVFFSIYTQTRNNSNFSPVPVLKKSLTEKIIIEHNK